MNFIALEPALGVLSMADDHPCHDAAPGHTASRSAGGLTSAGRRMPMAGFLVATWDGGGNTVPTVAIARELQERGHRVRVLGLTSQVDAFRAEGLDLLPYPSAGDFPIGGSPLAVLRLVSNRAMGRHALAALASDPDDLDAVDTALIVVLGDLRR